MQRRHQRGEKFGIAAAAADRGLVDRLAHLGRACGADRPFGAMKVEAARVPWQGAMIKDASR